MTAMELKDMLDISEKLETRLNSYWNFYVLSVIASVGWLYSTSMTINSYQLAILAVGMIVLFSSNLGIILDTGSKITAIDHEISRCAVSRDFGSVELKRKLESWGIPNRYWHTVIVHIVIDLGVFMSLVLDYVDAFNFYDP